MLKERSWPAPLAMTLGAFTLLGFGLRATEVGEFWLNPDEGLRYFAAHAGWRESVEMVLSNAHPPLYSVLLRALAPLSDSIVWLRAPSLLLGSASILAIFFAGRRAGSGSEWSGFIAAALLALSPGAIMLSQVARPYAAQLFTLSMAVLYLLRLLETRRSRDTAFHAAWMAAAIATHYSTLITLPGVAAVLAFSAATGRLGRAELRVLALAYLPLAILTVALYAFHIGPRLMGSSLQTEAVEGWLGPYFAASPGELWKRFLGVFAYLLGPPLALAGAWTFLGSCALCLGQGRPLVVLLGAGVFATAFGLCAASVYPFGAIRHILYLAPFVFLPIAVAARGLIGRPRFALAVLAGGSALWVLGATSSEVQRIAGAGALRTPYRELQIPMREGREIGARLTQLSLTPGAIVTDWATTNLLSPLIVEAWNRATRLEGPKGFDGAILPWGQRRIVVLRHWSLVAGAEVANPAAHLSTALRAARRASPRLRDAVDRDLRVVTSTGSHVLVALRRLASDAAEWERLVDRLEARPHFSLFRLDPRRYLEALAPQASRDRRGPSAETAQLGSRVRSASRSQRWGERS